jgi:hypothetical protein
MDTVDSKGTVLPIGATEHGIISKKVADKNGQGQGPGQQLRKKTATIPPPEEGEDTQTEKHAIDIVV